MTHDCEEWRPLVQAGLDGELDAGEAARLALHMRHCRDCTALQAQLAGLSARLREAAPRHAAPAALRQAIAARIGTAGAAAAPPARRRSARPWTWPWTWQAPVSFGAGMALAACLALVLLPRGGDLPGAVVADHIRALQPGHLTDVLSSDQHTVKPWFDGKLDFAPPVRDFAAQGFPLLGGRLDYLDSRPVAALVYGHAKHVIDVYVWPSGRAPRLPASGTRAGYNFISGTAGGMVFWAVSDLEAGQLADFARLWKSAA
ncbi:MAG: zf-HC2 domain-containing protein [Acidisphaera sp.]|nr:zf-HC2 domain-containing protein [Acidisphaera sp.]